MPGLGRSQDAYDRFSSAVALPLTILALIWLPILIIPIVAHLPPGVTSTFDAVDYVVWAAFAIEYGIKLYLTPLRRHYFTHHLIELAVVALPLLRPLRALRLLPVLNLGRAGLLLANALRRLRGMLTHHGLHYVLIVVLGVIVVCAALELEFEDGSHGSNIQNFGDAIWWATVTVTTVGYGDKYPVSAGGRGIAVVLMVVGIGLIGVLTATVASYFIGTAVDEQKMAVDKRLERIESMLTLALKSSPEVALQPDSGSEPSSQHVIDAESNSQSSAVDG
jgi:voltage-gated potassium channel